MKYRIFFTKPLFLLAIALAVSFSITSSAFANRDPGPGGMFGPTSSHIGHTGSASQYADGMNLYQYVRSNPTTLVDPMGTVVWTNGETKVTRQDGNPPLRIKSYKGGIQWPRAAPLDTLAVTIPRLYGKYTCKKDAECWTLSESKLTLINEIYMYAGYTDRRVEQWVKRAEQDHVNDYIAWANTTGKPLADELETALKGNRYPTEEDCKEAALSAFRAKMQPALLAAVKASVAKLDDTGRHTWDNPNHRP
ncbi:MAG: hypothetical protein WC058_01285 [Phycisphaeraceae bacterium]